jgi:hypothetical protein
MNALASDPTPNRSRMFKVISPIEKKTGGTYWMRVGTGFANKDQSVNVYLDAMPFNHTLQIREMDEEDFAAMRKRKDESGAPQRALNEIPF